MDRERAVAQQWRQLHEPKNEVGRGQFRIKAPHNVDECGCFTCTLCRATESALAELDRITGAGFEGSDTNTPLGSV